MGLGLNYERVVEVGEHTFQKPLCPTDKSSILFLDQKREDAYWRRIVDFKEIWFSFIPWYSKLYQEATLYSDDDGSLLSLNKEDSDYIVRTYETEMHRRRNGLYFRNGEDIEWITGNHYFVLQWMAMLGL